MPAHLMYTQIAGMTVVAYLVKLIPNVEGFVILLTQTITVLYMIYYILMFTAFLCLRYDQPNRPRSFKVPGGKFGTWLVAGLGLISSAFAIVLAIYSPAQVKSKVGSPTVYISVILALVAVVLIVCFSLYQLSKKHTDWVNPNNKFAPFTWKKDLRNLERLYQKSQQLLCLKIKTQWVCQSSVLISQTNKYPTTLLKLMKTTRLQLIKDK